MKKILKELLENKLVARFQIVESNSNCNWKIELEENEELEFYTQDFPTGWLPKLWELG